MTIQVNLKPEMEAHLIAQATAKGISVEQYLEFWIETNLTPEIERSLPQTENTQEWVKLLEAFCNNPALANVPPLSDEAISRESIYREREDSQL